MIIKPYAKENDLWFKISRRGRDPDKSDVYFARSGEFSAESDIAFGKHLKRLDNLNHNPYYAKMNGQRIKEIRRQEAFWYMFFLLIGVNFLLFG